MHYSGVPNKRGTLLIYFLFFAGHPLAYSDHPFYLFWPSRPTTPFNRTYLAHSHQGKSKIYIKKWQEYIFLMQNTSLWTSVLIIYLEKVFTNQYLKKILLGYTSEYICRPPLIFILWNLPTTPYNRTTPYINFQEFADHLLKIADHPLYSDHPFY